MLDSVQQAVSARLGGSPGGAGPQRIPTAMRAALGMPTLNTATIVDSNGSNNTLENTCTYFDYPGIISRMRIVFGKQDAFKRFVYPTLPITDDGSTGSGFLKLITFPKGVITISKVYPSLPVVLSAATAWTCTTGVMSIGSAQAGTDASLTATEQDILPAQTLKLLTYSANARVIGAVMSASMTTLTLRTGILTTSTTEGTPAALPALLDNTGGTNQATFASGSIAASGTTLATVVTGATIVANTQNNFSTLAAYINEIRRRTEGLFGLRFDGTTTALSLYLNFACNSDPGAAQTASLGQLTSGSEFVQPPGYIDIDYINNYGASSTAVFDVPPPLHGAGGG